MRKGKPPFAEDSENSDETDGSRFSPVVDEHAYLTMPNAGRRQLTPRDIEHNQRVETLFSRLVPGLPIDTDPPETRRDAEPFSAIMEKTLKRLKIDASPWLEELTGAWQKILPPEVTSLARPGKWDNGILYVYVTNSVHLFELRRRQLKSIEQAVRAFAGDNRVKHVRLMVNAVPLPFNCVESASKDGV